MRLSAGDPATSHPAAVKQPTPDMRPARHPDRAFVFALLLALFGLTLFIADRFSQPSAGHLTPAAQRQPMPDLTLTDLTNAPWTLTDHRGQPVLINYWATWCGPCREETPGLVQLATTGNVAILGISLDAGGATPTNRAKVAAFATHFHVPYALAFPPAGSQMEFGMELIPTTILVDRRGRVAKTYEGAVRRAVFAADIAQLQREQ